MRNTVLSYLLLPLLGLSIAVHAAPATTAVSATESDASHVVAPTGNPPKFDLNTVDAVTLQRELNGIGMAKAEAIVAYRENNGPFTSVDELLEVKGIGKALLDRNRAKLSVE
ncbi:ComEA family DNA-binding protein [Pseudomonas maumuensis]|uniref:Helix-hairpin-helix domain-containing protein n=1 Tax=Pseudomonas maumuensis TaxID=2842354 RepID=A0ABX8NIN2_9PSED|nr:helix-hairpin-helix domain-containing protein [Pseudomonas maumuensis]QXH55413.1 helix-hairpin-helix domain-containing protein [Pseudomonas maumuensis]